MSQNPHQSTQTTVNLVEIVNYEMPESDVIQTVNDLKTRKNCTVNQVSQQELLDKFLNWSWIRWSSSDNEFYTRYVSQSEPINQIYANNEDSEKMWVQGFGLMVHLT